MNQIAVDKKVKSLDERLTRIEGLILGVPRPRMMPPPTKSVWERTAGMLSQSKANDLLRSVKSVRRDMARRSTRIMKPHSI